MDLFLAIWHMGYTKAQDGKNRYEKFNEKDYFLESKESLLLTGTESEFQI